MPIYESSTTSTVTGASADIAGADLVAGQSYVLVANVSAWFKVGADPVTAAVDTDNNHLIVAGQERVIEVTENALRVAIIKDTGEPDGRCSLSKVKLT